MKTFTLQPISVLIIFLIVSISGCASQSKQADGNDPKPKQFKLKSLAKRDVDTVAEIHLNETFKHLRVLMIKLYKRNPSEWKKNGHANIEATVAWVFDRKTAWTFEELHDKRSIESIRLAFDKTFKGDRVMAFIVGLVTMIIESYNNKTEFYVFEKLDPQKLYNAARNIEIAVWMLSNWRDDKGKSWLLSNSQSGEPPNLSFERNFGKIIGLQDAIAVIIADKTNRTIKHVILGVASAVFLPI